MSGKSTVNLVLVAVIAHGLALTHVVEDLAHLDAPLGDPALVVVGHVPVLHQEDVHVHHHQEEDHQEDHQEDLQEGLQEGLLLVVDQGLALHHDVERAENDRAAEIRDPNQGQIFLASNILFKLQNNLKGN